jgi:phospholipase C
MGFYNVQYGDAPYFKFLADNYSMSDNFHQSVMGGTGANHIMLGFGDAIWFSDGNGNPAIPAHNQLVFGGTVNAGVVDEIENPNPAAGTHNWYTEDGYGGGGFGFSAVFGGGSYTACGDGTQPGVDAVVNYLGSLPRKISPNCDANHYYLLNNYNPGYFGDGSNAYTDNNINNTPFLRFHLRACATSATPCSTRTSRGNTTAISGINISPTSTSLTMGQPARPVTSTAISAISFSTRLRS